MRILPKTFSVNHATTLANHAYFMKNNALPVKQMIFESSITVLVHAYARILTLMMGAAAFANNVITHAVAVLEQLRLVHPALLTHIVNLMTLRRHVPVRMATIQC
jgi:hypothetical protein